MLLDTRRQWTFNFTDQPYNEIHKKWYSKNTNDITMTVHVHLINKHFSWMLLQSNHTSKSSHKNFYCFTKSCLLIVLETYQRQNTIIARRPVILMKIDMNVHNSYTWNYINVCTDDQFVNCINLKPGFLKSSQFLFGHKMCLQVRIQQL